MKSRSFGVLGFTVIALATCLAIATASLRAAEEHAAQLAQSEQSPKAEQPVQAESSQAAEKPSPVTDGRTIPDVVRVIPKSCWGFLLINRLSATNKKIVEIESQLQLPFALDPLAMLKMNTGIAAGIDESRSAALAIAEGPEGDPPAVLLFVPISNYAKVLETLGVNATPTGVATVEIMNTSLLVRQVKDFAVFAEPQYREILETVGKTPDISSDVPASWDSWLTENDLALALAHNGVQLAISQFQASLAEVQQALAGGGMPGGDAASMANAATMLKTITDLTTAAKEELKAVGVGLQRDSSGSLRLTSREAFVDGGKVAQALASFSPAQVTPLALLPKEPLISAYSGVVPQKLTDSVMQFYGAIMSANPQSGLSKEQTQKFIEITEKAARGILRREFLLTAGKSGEGLFSRMLSADEVEDSQAYLDQMVVYTQSLNEIFKDAKTPTGQSIPLLSEVKKIQIAGKPAVEFVMDYSKMISESPLPIAKELWEQLFGKDGKITVYMVAANQHTVVTGYNNQDRILETLKVIEKKSPSLAEDQGIQAAAALLPANTPWVSYWSIGGTIEFANHMLDMVRDELPPNFKLPEFPKTPPVGSAITISSTEIQTFLAIPSEVLQGIGSYIPKVNNTINSLNQQ